MAKVIEKYNKPTRVLHWTHAVAFVILLLTGLTLWIPELSFLAEGGATRIIHRVAAVFFIVAPILRLLLNWSGSWGAVGKALKWGKDDIEWLKAAPRYYFLNDESAMPPQDEMNTGQKLWWAIAIDLWIVFIITGVFMWFFKGIVSAAVLQWMVFFHDVAMAVAVPMLLVHIYLAIIHPLMTEAWNAMWHGTVSEEYAKSHHGKWYEEVMKGK